MRASALLWALGLATSLGAQSITTFPNDYANVPEGPFWSDNLPLAWGTSRVMTIYDAWDLAVPNGMRITRIGFRQDGQMTTLDVGHALQLEVRMGYAMSPASAANSVFDQNYTTAPTTVFGPALFTLPNLRDPASPLPNGVFWLALATPFVFHPANGNLIVEYRIYGNNVGGAAFPYYLDRAWAYTPSNTGVPGCPHSGSATPVLSTQPPVVANQFYFQVSSAPANSLTVLLLTPNGRMVAPYSLQPILPGIAASCMGQLPLPHLVPVVGVADPYANAYFYLNVPANRIPCNDMWVGAQAVSFDFFSPGGVVVSNAMEVQIGIVPSCMQIYAQGPPLSQVSGYLYYGYCPVAFFEYQ